MRTKVLFVWIVFLLGIWQNVNASSPIEHLIVVMLENRSFDHVFGYLAQQKAGLNGLRGTESNPYDPTDPNSPVAFVTNNASQVTEIDPPHSVSATGTQIFGYNDASDSYDRSQTAPMNGFVYAAERRKAGTGANALECFDPANLPVTVALAKEFAVFDSWFSSVPGPTQVNRMFLHTATSHGEIENNREQMVDGYPQKTIFNSLSDKNIPWKIYMDPITTVLLFDQMRYPRHLVNMKDYKYFRADVLAGKLAKYVVIEPSFYTWSEDHPATDQHPGHDMAQGEKLLKEVYETVRNSQYWHKTAILVTYDEHGGYYDHVSPPSQGVPNPDNITANGTVKFNFDRLGVRVPSILISSRVKRGSVIPQPTSGQWEHSSVPATVKKLFNLPNFLTARDAWAASFEGLFTQIPRLDCPFHLPDPMPPSTPSYRPDSPLSDLQEDLTTLAGGLNMWFPIANGAVNQLQTETQAFHFARTQVNTYFARKTRGLLTGPIFGIL